MYGNEREQERERYGTNTGNRNRKGTWHGKANGNRKNIVYAWA
jgi:hypothetical protein